jgi:translation initiation factor IF-3
MGKRQPKTSTKKQELNLPRTNREIPNYPSVRVVYVDDKGENANRVISMYDARRMADDMGLDLIEMNPNANPPVVKLYDFSKYVYELKKMKKAASHKQNEVKEVQLSTNISLHDLEIKANKAKE